MIDLDHFKNVNDTHGHIAGDAVLKEVARRMASCLRPYDTVGRYGGEEFVIVLPTCDRAGAGVVAERILKSVSTIPIVTGQGEITITISCGISFSHGSHPIDPQVLLHLADEALYKAKAEGRNRAEFASEAELSRST